MITNANPVKSYTCVIGKKLRNWYKDSDQPIKIRMPTAALQKIAAKQLNEKPELLEQEIQELRKWIDNHDYLRARKTEQFLLAYLRSTNHDMKLAKQQIELFYELRSKYPKFFTMPDIYKRTFKDLVKEGILVLLADPITTDGPRVILVRFAAFNESKYTFSDLIQLLRAIQELLIMDEDNAIINGLIYILDCKNITFSKIFKLNNFSHFALFLNDGFLINTKSVHFIELPYLLEMGINMIKFLSPKDIDKKLFSYEKNPDELFKVIPESILPTEYGGTAGNIQDQINYLEAKIYAYRDYFMEDLLFGTSVHWQRRMLNYVEGAEIRSDFSDFLNMCLRF